jgi:hypothetical protein
MAVVKTMLLAALAGAGVLGCFPNVRLEGTSGPTGSGGGGSGSSGSGGMGVCNGAGMRFSPPQQIAMGPNPRGLVVNGGFLYWLEGPPPPAKTNARRVPLGNAMPPQPIFDNQDANALTIVGDRMFFSSTFGLMPPAGVVRAVSLTNFTLEMPIWNSGAARDIAYSNGMLFWLGTTPGMPPATGIYGAAMGGSGHYVGGFEQPTLLRVQPAYLLYVSGGRIYREPKTGGSQQVLDSGPALDLAADVDSVYWAGSDGTIKGRLSADDGATYELAANQVEPRLLTADGVVVYWAKGNDGVRAVCREGGDVTVVADQQPAPITGLTAAGNEVYWAAGGALWRSTRSAK